MYVYMDIYMWCVGVFITNSGILATVCMLIYEINWFELLGACCSTACVRAESSAVCFLELGRQTTFENPLQELQAATYKEVTFNAKIL